MKALGLSKQNHLLHLNQTSFKIRVSNLNHLPINVSWINGKLNGITALAINFLRENQLLIEYQSDVRNIRKEEVVWLDSI